MGSSLQQVKEKGSCLSSSSSSSERSLEAEAEDDNNNNNNIKKCCSVCKTTKTPLWRNGPKGPKSLCNACGIRYRKKHKHHTHTTTIKNNASFAFAENEPRKGKVVKSRNTVSANNIKKPFTDRTRQLGEVERAALLLMAISCGTLFA